MSKAFSLNLLFDTLLSVIKMDLYYQNETLYVDIMDALDTKDYSQMETKIFRIIEDYGVSKIVIKNHNQAFHNRQFLRQMKQNYASKYVGEFVIR